MKLTERLSDTKYRLTSILQDIVSALSIKGVVAPNGFTYTQVPKYIRQIYQSDFEFVFNFRNIDQFGNPHVPDTGQSIGGMKGLSPDMSDFTPPEYTFDTSFDFLDTISSSGYECSSNEPPITIMSDVVYTTLENFNEQTIPEELNYDPTFKTT